MFGEMLLSGRVRTDEKRQQYLEIIVRESERLTALIENVLDFAALERGKQKYRLTEGHLAEAIQKAIDTFRYRVEHEGIDVTLTTKGELPPVALDEQGIVLAVINLLDNAVKYGGRTPIEVSVEPKARWIEVSVRDRGPGIPEVDKKRVFDRFFRTTG
jgi:two-component system phosphate regulon sensor histidine kinase PhoR